MLQVAATFAKIDAILFAFLLIGFGILFLEGLWHLMFRPLDVV